MMKLNDWWIETEIEFDKLGTSLLISVRWATQMEPA
jgi:hypothetical protein